MKPKIVHWHVLSLGVDSLYTVTICREFKSNLVYITGYIMRRDRESGAEDSHNYFEKYGNYSELLNKEVLSSFEKLSFFWK